MAHKTLVGGTVYEASGGKTLVDGTAYSIAKGRTLVGGTGYDVSFGGKPEADALNDCSWANISEVAASGNAANYWAVGDTKAVTISGTVGTVAVNATYYVYIIGFDHNGATDTIDFGTFKTAAYDGVDVALIDGRYGEMVTDVSLLFNPQHKGAYNYGGWRGCDLRYDVLGSTDVAPNTYGNTAMSTRTGYDASATCATSPVAQTLMAALPSDLRAVMKPMTIYTDNEGGGDGTADCVTASIDYLPLLSEFELWGTQTSANIYEQDYQEQYAYYAAGNPKIKFKHSSPSTSCYLWTRSPSGTGQRHFCRVGNAVTQGAMTGTMCSYSYGLAPIFRV